MTKVLLLFCIFLFSALGHATNYYVSNNGNDNNDGLSEFSSWKTIEKVNLESRRFKPGDVIAFKGGDEFYGKLRFWNVNGLPGNPITLTTYGIGYAIIKGTKELTGWTLEQGNIYVADVPTNWNIYNLLINNIAKPNARIPDISGKYSTNKNYFRVTSKVSSTKFICTDLVGLTNITGATIHIQGKPWALEAKRVIAFNGATGEITIDSPTLDPFGDIVHFFINNHKSFLSRQNEWHYDSKNQKLYLFSTNLPANISVSLLNEDNVVLDNCSYVTIEKLHILGNNKSGIWIADSDDIIVQNSKIEYTGVYGINIYESPNCKLLNNEIKGITDTGLSVSSKNSLIENNHISDIGIAENFSYHGTKTAYVGGGVITYKTSIVRYNTIEDVGYNGLGIYGINSLAENNFIKNTCLTAHDGGAIYTHGWSKYPANGTSINNNIIINEVLINEKWESHGIYCDDDSNDIVVSGNSISGYYHNLFLHNNQRNAFMNNTSYQSLIEGILVRKDFNGIDSRDNQVKKNEIYLERKMYPPLKVENSIQKNIDLAVFDDNRYYNPISDKSVNLMTTSINKLYDLLSWRTLSKFDGNSIEDSFPWYDGVSQSKFVYNESKVNKTIFLNDAWWDLSGNRYEGYISLEPYTSAILINQEIFLSLKADAGKDQSICAGSSATLTASGGSVYKWSTGATTKSITVSPGATTTYSVTVSEGSDSDTDEVLVTVNTLPIADAGTDVTIESGQSTTLTATGGDSYLWSNGATTASITVNPTDTTTYEVTVNKNGCTSKDTVTVTVNTATTPPATVTADAGKDQTICAGSSATLTASGGSVYKWSTGATTMSITVSPGVTTTYSVTVSEGSVSDTDEVIVTVNEVPLADAGTDVTIESGQSTTLTATGGDTYIWSNGAATASITVNPTVTTTYEVTVNKNGCTSKDTVTVIVNTATAPPVTVMADAGQDQTICIGNSTTLTASGGSVYKWSTGATTKSITVSPGATTTYSVTVSEGSVSDTDEVLVTVNPLPVADAGSNKTIELGQSVELTATGGDTYLWSTGETTQSITVKPGKSTIYSVTVNQNGCSSGDSVQVTVNVPPPADANAGSDLTICKGESITLNGDGGATYSWSTGATTRNITVSPNRTTTYTLTANRGGTTSTDEVIVTVINCDLNNGVNNSVSGTTGNTATTDPTDQDDEQVLNKADFELTVYPNPTEGKLNVQTTVPIYNFNLVLMNINGNVIYSDEMDAAEDGFTKEIDLSGFAKGVYLLQLYNAEESYVKKVIVI